MPEVHNTASHIFFVQHRGSQPGPSSKLSGHTAGMFMKGLRWEFVHLRLQQRGRAPLRPPCHNAEALLRVQQTDGDLWDLSQDDACDFISLYTFNIYPWLHTAFWKASLSGYELYLLGEALSAAGFSLTPLAATTMSWWYRYCCFVRRNGYRILLLQLLHTSTDSSPSTSSEVMLQQGCAVWGRIGHWQGEDQAY